MPVTFVLGNVSDPDRRRRVADVVDLLRARGVDAAPIDESTPDAARSATCDAVTAGAERIVAVGGDGVVSLAVQAVAGTDAVLGVVPDGTGNDFARALGLDDGSIDDQVERALAAPVTVDAARCEHGWIASVATLGFSGDVTARANRMRWPSGQSKYTVATLAQLPRLRILDVDVEVDGEPWASATTLLAIGNTAYFGGGMRICPDATPTDGLLHVVNIGAVPRRTFVRVFPTVFSGRHVDRSEVSVTTGRTVSLVGDGIELWADGERLGPLPVAIEVVPAALHVAGATT